MTADIINLAEARRARRDGDFEPRVALIVWPIGLFFCAAFYALMAMFLSWCVPVLAHPLVHLPF